MLLNLHVKNLALIDEVEVDFFDHLNILTGETGAGKSILIGSIEAALGGKLSKDMIRQGADYALIELLFRVESEDIRQALVERDVMLEDGQVMITRKLMPNRNVCRINGETVTLSTLKEVSSLLLDLHGQQENLTLKNPANQLSLLDQYAGEEAQGLRQQCTDDYQKFQKKKKEYEQYLQKGDDILREIRFMEYEVQEIREAQLKPDEDEELEQRYKKMVNAKRVVEVLSSVSRYTAHGAEATVSSLLGQSIREMVGIETIDKTTAGLYEQLGQIDSLLGDFNRELTDYMNELSFDEAEYQEVAQRLDTVNRLKSKYGNSVEQILAYAEEREAELAKYQNIEEYQASLKKEYEALKKQLLVTCEKLSGLRAKYAGRMAEQIKEVLVDLNFLQVQFDITLSKEDQPTAVGYDRVEFLISTNPGLPLRPMGQVASGGELSRIMLAVKSVLADVDMVETLIFDEIDTGVSGRTAQMVAEKLCVISRRHQVICITHLPQIAAMADTHFQIVKEMEEDSTKTEMKMLYEEASVNELARLLGGAKITDTVLQNAKEMKQMAAEKKRMIGS